jgi:hypothetical protein
MPDLKFQELNEELNPNPTDIFPMVNDPFGTPPGS